MLYGVVLLWLLALVPAAVVTVLKGHWLFFWCGWLTLGATWMIGAVALASPRSRWARSFYDLDKMVIAEDPALPRRSRGRPFAWIGAVLAAIVVLGLFGARPAPVLGVGGRALQSSVGGREFEPCRQLEDRIWSCEHYDDMLSGGFAYRVSVNRGGCWTATRQEGQGSPSARELRGCLTLIDYL